MNAVHPLFRQLRKKLLWHCTNTRAFRQIHEEGFVRPAEGTTSRWGSRPYACQTLGAVCLFDFTTDSEERVLSVADRWQQFVHSDKPVTVILGLDETKLPGKLVRYPENRDITPMESSGPIPYVEVCHVGPIPVSAVVLHLLVCPIDCSRFHAHERLDEQSLLSAEQEFGELCRINGEKEAAQLAKFREVMDSPELKAQLERAKQGVKEMG